MTSYWLRGNRLPATSFYILRAEKGLQLAVCGRVKACCHDAVQSVRDDTACSVDVNLCTGMNRCVCVCVYECVKENSESMCNAGQFKYTDYFIISGLCETANYRLIRQGTKQN